MGCTQQGGCSPELGARHGSSFLCSCTCVCVCVCVCVYVCVCVCVHGRVGAVREREFQLSVPWASDRTMWNILVFSKVGPSPGEPAGEM